MKRKRLSGEFLVTLKSTVVTAMPAEVVISAGCRTQTQGRPHPNGNSETLKDQKTRHWQADHTVATTPAATSNRGRTHQASDSIRLRQGIPPRTGRPCSTAGQDGRVERCRHRASRAAATDRPAEAEAAGEGTEIRSQASEPETAQAVICRGHPCT